MSYAPTPLPARWSVWPGQPADGPLNMATDAALMKLATPGVGVWRWYAWSSPTISFGRNERVLDRFSRESVAATGLAAVRRPTGGRALLHAREVTYSATFTLAAEAGWRDAYSAINRILQGALQTIGVNATLAASRPPMAPDGPVCFDQPAEGELVMAGRKLVGSAVWRQGMRYLQHGSILLHDDQALLSRAAVCPLPPTPPAAALATVRPDLDAWGLQGALDAALREQLRARVPGAFVTGFTPDASLLAEIRSGRHEFTNEQRLWRR